MDLYKQANYAETNAERPSLLVVCKGGLSQSALLRSALRRRGLPRRSTGARWQTGRWDVSPLIIPLTAPFRFFTTKEALEVALTFVLTNAMFTSRTRAKMLGNVAKTLR